ncbi:MAG TPA: MaoC family dehydratase N-terminal domain-containing protein [Usitatibacter sp.]|nr:MaoC family dehydratase N-terminal domain-containing protein [Usitatibacter sp.]
MSETRDLADLARWIGRSETRDDTFGAAPLAELSALLDRDDPEPRPGEAIPPLAHWLYFLPTDRQSDLGPDGHARRGGFLPPVPLPRRMWAGSRLEFLRPLAVGTRATRKSTIRDVNVKRGRSGTLVFVTVRHEISDANGLAVADEHDIVYRGEAGASAAPVPAPGGETWRREIHPDPVLLFRYSAVTFNGHRIHYDHPYVTGVEGYPGLVVHGPLIATLLVDLLRRNRPDAALRRFSFRAVRPLFDTAPFATCGLPDEAARTARLWTRDAQGAITMDATAEWG